MAMAAMDDGSGGATSSGAVRQPVDDYQFFDDDVLFELDAPARPEPSPLRGGRRVASEATLQGVPQQWQGLTRWLGLELRESQAAGLAARASREPFALIAATGSGKGLLMQIPALSGWIHGGATSSDMPPVEVIVVPYKSLALHTAVQMIERIKQLWHGPSPHPDCVGKPPPDVLLIRRRSLPSGAEADGANADCADGECDGSDPVIEGDGMCVDSGGGDVECAGDGAGVPPTAAPPHDAPIDAPSLSLPHQLPCGVCPLCLQELTLSARQCKALSPLCIWSCRTGGLEVKCADCEKRERASAPLHYVAGCKVRQRILRHEYDGDPVVQTEVCVKTRSKLDELPVLVEGATPLPTPAAAALVDSLNGTVCRCLCCCVVCLAELRRTHCHCHCQAVVGG